MRGCCSAGAARCATTRIGRPMLAILLIPWDLRAGVSGCVPMLHVRLWQPLAYARGSADLGSAAGPLPCGRGLLVWWIWPLACARGSVFLVPAGYQPLGVAGQRVIGRCEPETRPRDAAGRVCRNVPPLWKRTEQRISLVKPVARLKFFTMLRCLARHSLAGRDFMPRALGPPRLLPGSAVFLLTE